MKTFLRMRTTVVVLQRMLRVMRTGPSEAAFCYVFVLTSTFRSLAGNASFIKFEAGDELTE
jgi:hypothetical protein